MRSGPPSGEVHLWLARVDAFSRQEIERLGRFMSPFRQDYTALVGQAGEQVNGIYEADYRDFNRETYARGRETFDATYAMFKKLLVGSWRRDELEQADRRELEAVG